MIVSGILDDFILFFKYTDFSPDVQYQLEPPLESEAFRGQEQKRYTWQVYTSLLTH